MKNCPKCGTELADDVAFCTECGEKLVEVEAAPKAAEAPKKTSVSLILGIVSIVLMFIPGLSFAYPITSIIGTVFGVKETKEGGSKVGLILNVIPLALFVIGFVLGILFSVLYVILYFIFGISILGGMSGMGLDFFELIEELLWEIGLI